MVDLRTPEDALPLLAYKIAPRQFDLSYRFSNISLRDQMVRGQTLVRTLVGTGLLAAQSTEPHSNFQLLICGAGAAGLAVAKEAAALDISFVLLEKGNEVPGGILHSAAQRYVSTAMYEWPHPNHKEHGFPLTAPSLLGSDATPLPSLALNFRTPVLIRTFGGQLRKALAADIAEWKKNFVKFQGGTAPIRRMLITNATLSGKSKADLREMLDRNVSIHGVPLHNAVLPAVALDAAHGAELVRGLHFEYIVYAVGFAKEALTYADGQNPFPGFKHTPFWEVDQIFDLNLGCAVSRPHVGILGSGDGALQDALRCLVNPKYRHPLAIWNGLMDCEQGARLRLRNSPHVRKALAEVAAADSYTTGGAIWTNQGHIFHSLDQTFMKVVDELIKHEASKLQHAVDTLSRNDVGEVTVVTQYGYFSKAYALNRFLVLLLNRLLASSKKANSVKLAILSGAVTKFEKVGSNCRGARMEIAAHPGPVACDVVIIRGGLDRSAPPTQQAGLSGIDTGRAGLGRIPAPIRPVSMLSAPRNSPMTMRSRLRKRVAP